MDDLKVILPGLEFKILQLLKELEQTGKENLEIKRQLSDLQQKEKENKLKIKYLEEQNNIIKITNSIEGSENKTKAKLKINELLREVDRCLALLNK